MKTNITFIVVALLLLLGTTAPAQNRVLATSGGYQLTDGDLRPVLELVVFLAQSQLTESEIQSIAGEALGRSPPLIRKNLHVSSRKSKRKRRL